MYYPCENCFAFECCNCTFGNQSIEMQELCDITREAAEAALKEREDA